MSASAAKQFGRFDALDTLRCLAVLVMVQGHTFYLVMDDAVREASWYGWHNYLHGFTAPAFLFGAGLAFGVTTLRDFESHTHAGPVLYKRLYRYLGLFAIGYALQLPPLHLDMTAISAVHLKVFFRVEALQHREGESRGFPGTRLRTAHQIASSESRWNRITLNGGGCVVAGLFDRSQ